MVMRSMRGEGKFGGIMKYVLFTFLGMAVGGLVLGGFSGSGNVGSNDVAKIGNKTIDIRSFDRALQRAVSKYNISSKQAYKIGMAEDVLAGEIRSYFLLNEAEKLGIEISKAQLAKRIAQVVAPYKQDNETLQDTLENILRRQGMNEKEFVSEIKKEISGEILINAIKAGFSPATDLLTNDLYEFQTQTRDIELILFPDNNIDNIEPATKDQLKRLYDTVKSRAYKIPEYRSVKVATLDPEKIDIEFSVPEEEIKSAYEKNPNNFRIGEQLVLSQVVTKDEKEANDIYALVEKGSSLKAAVIKIMGKDAAYIEGVKFETTMMLPDLMETLKDREIGKVVPPVKTTLGYHVVKLDDILQPSIKPYREVHANIERELLEAKKSDYFYDISTEFDEMLSDEMTFEDIATKMDITISSIDFIDSAGLNKQGSDGLENFEDQDKKDIAETIFEIEKGAPSSFQDFGGKLVAFAINTKEEASHKPFETVEKELADKFMSDQKRLENDMLMRKYLAEISTNGSTFESIAKENNAEIITISDIAIGAEATAPLNADAIPVVFQTALGEHQTIRLDGQNAIIKISGYGFSVQDDAELKAKSIESIATRINGEAKDEALLVYLQMLGKKYSATINNRLLERVYGEQDDEG